MYYQIKGFKGLKKTTKLDMAPITILVGKNGSGKSSAISFLDKIKEVSTLGSRWKENKMESFLSFDILRRTDFGCEIGDHLEYAFPINLSFFEDKFELRTMYQANHDFIYLLKFEIYNKTKNETLFNVSRENAIVEDELGKVNKSSKVCVKINLDYLINEFKRLKNIEPFDVNDLHKYIRTGPPTPEDLEDIESERQRFEDYKKNLQIGFDEYENNFKLKDTELNEIKGLRHKFENLQSNLEDLSLLKLKKQNEIIDAEEYMEELITSIQNGIDYKYGSELPGINHFLIDLFDRKSKHQMFSNESLSSFICDTTGYNLPTVLDAKITLTPFFEELIDHMLFDNIHSNTSYLLARSKFTYIPPNRINRYSENNESSAGFAMKTLTKALKHFGYSDKSSSFFINYWFKQFDISDKVYNLDLALKLLEDKKNIEKEGYGIQQIIPLIIILSLSDKLHNSDLKDDPNQWMQSQYNMVEYENINKFLIEEPEANLHPSFQSKLADLFLDAWIKYDHEFVIETHSEYLIRKLQYHVGTGKIDPSIINIYYFDKNEKPRKINIKKDGNLSAEFGTGFYDEADNIAIDLFMLNNKQLN